MLFNLGRHLELVTRLRRTLWRTLAYPVAVLAAFSFLLLFIAVFVLPKFHDIYYDFRVTLPALTVVMMAAAHVYPWVFVVGWALILLVVLGDAAAPGRRPRNSLAHPPGIGPPPGRHPEG